MGRAGGSARLEYERRRANDRAQIRGNLGQRVAVLVAAPILMFLAVRYVAPWALGSLIDGLASPTPSSEASATPSPMPVDPGLWTTAGVVMAVGAAASVGRQLFGRRQTTEAWRKGADGEVQTARVLDRLPRSFSVRHDLPMPGSRANIDHVVIGPTGVFTIETKRYASGVRIRHGRVVAGGAARSGIVTQAQRQATAVSDRLGRPVTPLIVVHGGVDVGWFGSAVVDGVRICSPGRLCKAITKASNQMSGDEIADALARLAKVSDRPRSPSPEPEARPRAAPSQGCRCGGTWVLRHRRSDGAPFFGCSAFPACRQTRPIGDGG